MTVVDAIVVQKLIIENKIVIQKIIIDNAIRMITKKKQVAKNE